MNPVEHYRIDAELFDYDISDPSSLEEYRRRYEGLFEMAQFRKGQTLVEIGTGSGPAKSLCQALELQHFAVDLSLLNLKKLNQNGIWTRPILASAYELPFADHSVDSVLMSEVLEHIPDPLLALKEINRILKPQGTLLLSVPWRETLRYHLCIHCNHKTPADGHLHSIDESKLESWLKTVGFQSVRQQRILHKGWHRIGGNRWTRRLPFKLWFLLDSLWNRLWPKASSLQAIAHKP